MRNIDFGSIYHMPWLEYRHALPDGRVCLRLQTGRGQFSRVFARVTSNYALPDFFKTADQYPMELAFQDEWHDFYQVIFAPKFYYRIEAPERNGKGINYIMLSDIKKVPRKTTLIHYSFRASFSASFRKTAAAVCRM